MMVCAHGKVSEYCDKHDMHVCDEWSGELRDYRGPCRVLVTDSDISETEYYYLKGEMLAKGIELISTRYKDDKLLSAYLVYQSNRHKVRAGGRQPFADKEVIVRIKELRESGLSLRAIQSDEKVRNKDGKMLSLSTISKIINKES